MRAEHQIEECIPAVHPECEARFDGFDRRLEAVELGQAESRAILQRIAEDSAYTRGRLDQMHPAPKVKRRHIAINLGLGAGIVALIDVLKDHLK